MSSILFCTPCYGGQITEPAFSSAMRLTHDLILLDVKHEWNTARNESLVHRGRMEMTASFLETDFTHMMWLDADIEFTSEDVAALWNMQTDIAVGVYAMKKPDACWYAAWIDGKLVKDLDQFDGPIAVDYAGTGFMMLSRTVVHAVRELLLQKEQRYLKIIENLMPDDQRFMAEFKPPVSFEGRGGREVPALYMTPIVDDVLESEDYHFCRLAREAGFKIMMDPSVRLTHWGMYGYGARDG